MRAPNPRNHIATGFTVEADPMLSPDPAVFLPRVAHIASIRMIIHDDHGENILIPQREQ